MRSRCLICLSIVLAGLFGGCAQFDHRPAGVAPAASGAERDEESNRAELAREWSLYSD